MSPEPMEVLIKYEACECDAMDEPHYHLSEYSPIPWGSFKETVRKYLREKTALGYPNRILIKKETPQPLLAKRMEKDKAMILAASTIKRVDSLFVSRRIAGDIYTLGTAEGRVPVKVATLAADGVADFCVEKDSSMRGHPWLFSELWRRKQ